MSWNIAQAKQHFSDVVKQSADEPQLLYNRDRRVAAVINAEQFSSFQTWRQRQNMKPLGEAFAEPRQLMREENHELEIPPRSALRRSPPEFAREMRLAAAIHWYARGEISQEKAAMIAGLDRTDFLSTLAAQRIDVFQVDLESLQRELDRA